MRLNLTKVPKCHSAGWITHWNSTEYGSGGCTLHSSLGTASESSTRDAGCNVAKGYRFVHQQQRAAVTTKHTGPPHADAPAGGGSRCGQGTRQHEGVEDASAVGALDRNAAAAQRIHMLPVDIQHLIIPASTDAPSSQQCVWMRTAPSKQTPCL